MSRDTAHSPARVREDDGPPLAPVLVVHPDAVTGTLRVRGRLDRVGADLVAGSAEALCRQGHRHLHLQLEPPTADPEVLGLLAELVERFAACGIRIVVD
jgi:hypothetical protein